MKAFILLLACFEIFSGAKAQLVPKPHCDEFFVDILAGTLNGVRPDFTEGRVKEILPCFTLPTARPNPNAACGSQVIFSDRDVYFYTDRDYIEIREKFKGRMSIPLMGAARNSLFKWLGNPALKDNDWSAFQTEYGVIVLHFSKTGKVNLIQFSTKSTANLQLCE